MIAETCVAHCSKVEISENVSVPFKGDLQREPQIFKNQFSKLNVERSGNVSVLVWLTKVHNYSPR